MVISKVHKKLLLMFLLLLGGLSTQLSVGYSMYLGESFIGNVHNLEEANAIQDILQNETGIRAPRASLYLKLLPKNHFDAPHKVLASLRDAHQLKTDIFTETIPIPYETEIEKSEALFSGERNVKTPGKDGVRTVIKKKTFQDGALLSEEVLSDKTEVAPVSEIITEGTKPRPQGMGTGGFSLPLSEIQVSSSFGTRWNRQHAGIDLAAESGTHILAADSGTVIFSGACDGYGNLIILDHKNGFKTYYAHASVLYAEIGAVPEKGEVIAAVGSTGNSTGPHLHFEIRKDDVPLNPADFLPGLL